MAMRMMARGVGGGHFRKKVEAGLETTLSDITHEGLFGDYYFTVGEEKEKDFKPSYSFAVVRDPLSNEKQHYLCVGLNSKYDGEGIHKYGRPTCQLVVCLDTSGSMSHEFDPVKGGKASATSKLDAAKAALAVLFTHLRADDMFALLTFDEESHVIQPLAKWSSIGKEGLTRAIAALEPRGGTALSVGYVTAAAMLTDEAKKRAVQPAAQAGEGGVMQLGEMEIRPTERRIMFLTDMNPTTGETGKDGLFGIADRNAKIGIFSTFIGVGLDFNTELVNHITKNILAASYFSVLSEEDFRKQMAEDFDYLVSPLVFNVTLSLKAKTQAIAIDRIYGSPEADDESGELMKVGTLFPSARVNGETKGGVVLIKLSVDKQVEGSEKPSSSAVGEKEKKVEAAEGQVDKTKLELSVSFGARDSEGVEKQVSSVDLAMHEAPYFENLGVRKALLLTQFANLVTALLASSPLSARTGIPAGLSSKQQKAVAAEKRSSGGFGGMRLRKAAPASSPSSDAGGCTYREDGQLRMPPATVTLVKQFLEYFVKESTIIGDPKLNKEAEVLTKMLELNQKALEQDAKNKATGSTAPTMDDDDVLS